MKAITETGISVALAFCFIIMGFTQGRILSSLDKNLTELNVNLRSIFELSSKVALIQQGINDIKVAVTR